jgi:hypothetical protein
VEKRKPLSESNFSTAFISPMLPLLDELLLSLLVARTSLLGEDYLLAVGKETILAYLRQITGQQLRRFESTWGSGFGAPLWRERGL